MKRREFIKLTSVAGAGLLMPAPLMAASDELKGTRLVVAKGKNASMITRRAVEALGGMESFVKKGDRVVVKPNIGWDRTPEYAANTNPDVVAEIVRMCMEAGAREVKVFDRTVNNARRCYQQSGIEQAAKEAGAKVIHIESRRFKNVEIPGGRAITKWPLYRDAIEADVYINVPIAKHHGLGKLTMAMKNTMGLMGKRRSVIHQKLDMALVDLARVIKPALTVLDAVRVLTANGPQGGDLDDVKVLDTVIAGTDQVAVDAYGATLFGMSADDLGYVRLAEEQGIGVADLSKVSITKIEV